MTIDAKTSMTLRLTTAATLILDTECKRRGLTRSAVLETLLRDFKAEQPVKKVKAK